jgi:hypothetical protein
MSNHQMCGICEVCVRNYQLSVLTAHWLLTALRYHARNKQLEDPGLLTKVAEVTQVRCEAKCDWGRV